MDPGNNNTLKTDVTIAANDDVYTATSSNGGTIVGIRKSTNDGMDWTDVSPTLPETYGRTIIKTAPSNSSVVYFLTEGVSGTNNTPNVHNHQLWRSANSGAAWSNISEVIPANTAPDLDNFSTQEGYDMLLNIKPDDDKFIVVGGVSIFKIHDVTNNTMTLAQKHIGGYGISGNSTSNAVGDFKNHHPDSHIGVFKPGSNIIYYTGNDGGVHFCNDITAAASGTFWQAPLRAGFNVSQFYAVSIDKSSSGSAFIAGGLQDRGNWMARTNGSLQNWQEVSGGDGAFAKIDKTGTYVFMSTSKGEIFRFLKSDENTPVTLNTSIKPATLANPIFITPFETDENDENILYFSGGNSGNLTTSGVWRTTDATAATPTWGHFTNSAVATELVSAISVSKAGSANVLYYGTSGGKLFRIDGANAADLATTTPTNITGTGFPAGYVSSIAIDPSNSANVLVTFSNYNVDRIWHSTNSGSSWTSVTGNLTGANSPSVRWAKMFTVSSTNHYFIGTSTGVYFTTTLNGGSTNWTQEADNSIGNVVVTMLDYRASDNMLVAATHGRGVFQSQISSPLPVELVSFTGTVSGKNITLNWQTATETNNFGYEIERTADISSLQNNEKIAFTKIGFVGGKGNSNSAKNYSFNDFNISAGKYKYRLRQIDNDGKFECSNTVDIEIKNPFEMDLQQNFPNPFNPITTISYNLTTQGNVKLIVYDITGKVVATLVNGFQAVGNHKVVFNANNLSSGTYFYKLEAGNYNQIRKMLIIK